MNPRHGTASDTREQITLEFRRNALLSALAGSHSRNLVRLEQKLGVRLAQRGNLIAVEGAPELCERASLVLRALYRRLEANAQLMEYPCIEFAEEFLYGHVRKSQLVKHWEGETMIIDVKRKVPEGDKFFDWYRK